MRSKYSIKNAIISVIMNLITIVIGVVAQAIFIKCLGNEYLGIRGLFTNIVSMLAIAELGIGSAIIYHLYEPVAKNQNEKIKSLLYFYKKSYRVIAVIVTILGLSLLPFIKSIVGQVNISENVNFIYILFLIDTVASYLLSYKRSIIFAYQRNYIVNIIHIFYQIIMNAVQLILLYLTNNFIIFLVIMIVCRILENLVITIIANKMYPFIKEKEVENINPEIKQDIFKKIKGLIFHKIGQFVVLGSDNIIISKFLGVVTVGLYSNYNMILGAVSMLFSQMLTSISASVGNLLVKENEEKSYEVYKSMLMLNSWIYAFASALIYCIIDPFIKLWIGEQYILPQLVVIVLIANFYIQGMRQTFNNFKTAAGIFHEDRFVPIIESIVNIIASIILLKIFGLAGVFMGTIISTLIIYLYSYPIFVTKNLFHKSYLQYVKENLFYLVIAIISVLSSTFIVSILKFDNNVMQLIINTAVCLIIPNVIYYIILRNTKEFNYYKNMFKNLINRKI